MRHTFYGVSLLGKKISVLPPILGSIEAYRGALGDRHVTFVRSRPDIIANHLGGASSFSNVDHLAADLEQMSAQPAEAGELRLLEVMWVENRRIPFGLFAPISGWALRDVIGFVQCEPPLAVAIGLQIFRGYAGAPNVVTPEGALVREMLPHFSRTWRSEAPSFIGFEPDISIQGRIAEARSTIATIGGMRAFESLGESKAAYHAAKRPYLGHDDNVADSPALSAAFEQELLRVAAGVELGPQLSRLLANQYSMPSLWW